MVKNILQPTLNVMTSNTIAANNEEKNISNCLEPFIAFLNEERNESIATKGKNSRRTTKEFFFNFELWPNISVYFLINLFTRLRVCHLYFCNQFPMETR